MATHDDIIEEVTLLLDKIRSVKDESPSFEVSTFFAINMILETCTQLMRKSVRMLSDSEEDQEVVRRSILQIEEAAHAMHRAWMDHSLRMVDNVEELATYVNERIKKDP